MAVITPNTDVYLLKVPLEIDEMNQLTFASAEAQFNYFYNLPKLEATNYTYQRKDGTLRFGGSFDDLLSYNYVMYRNTNYSSKWFYAFISGMEYINDNVTAISLKTDVWQTWQFDLTFKPVLIDREHTNDDTVGTNTLPEGLELGEFVTNGTVTDFGYGDTGFCNVIDVTMVENTGESATLSYSWSDGGTHDVNPYVNGMPSGVIHLLQGINGQPSEYFDPQDIVRVYDFAGLGDAVVNVYPIPRSLIGNHHQDGLSIMATSGDTSKGTSNLSVLTNTFAPNSMSTTTFPRPSNIVGYTPKNNKLLTYPFCYFNISNNGGSTLPYHYEDFIASSNITFITEGAFSPSGSVKAIPQNYKNISTLANSYDYSITGAKYPIGSWVNDSYTNWLTQNAVNMQTQWKTTLIHAGANIISGGFYGLAAGREAEKPTAGSIAKAGLLGAGGAAITSGAELIALAREQHLAKTQANLVPDQSSGNMNCGDIVWAKNRCKFTYLPMSIKPEYARCIDEYFSQFGYKCNRVKIPNITGRRNWNYVKTVGCYIDADIPQDDLQEIKGMFDRGVTFWHNPATFADYSQNNDII